MMAGRAFSAALIVGLLVEPAWADGARLDLRALLGIGPEEPNTRLRWGISKEEIQHLYPEIAEANSAGLPGFRLESALTVGSCTFDVYLRGSRPDRLELVGIQYRTGSVPKCRKLLESKLKSLY